MTDEPLAGPINISFAHFDDEIDPDLRGALVQMIEHSGLGYALVAGVLELVPDSSIWRLIISGDMVATVTALAPNSDDEPYTTNRGAGHVGAITLPQKDGTFDIVISGHTLVASRVEIEQIDEFVQHVMSNAEHLARHEAGHVLLRVRNEDSDAFQDLDGLTPTDAVWRKRIAAHIDDHRIERYTATHAPSPFSHVDHLADAIAHIRDELNYSKRTWQDDIMEAARRTMTATNGLIRVIAYLSSELGLDEQGRAIRPEPKPTGWDDYLETSWDEWSRTFHRLRPVDQTMAVPELELILASLCQFASSWLLSIGVDYGLSDDEQEFIFWNRASY